MKKTVVVALTLALLVVCVSRSLAQDQTARPATPAAQGQPGDRAASAPLLKPEQLQQIVAPIALYPDPLLAEVLMASTYPLEVVEAERWVKAHKNLNGEKLKAEAGKKDWDDSIKALTATPTVLEMMSGKLEWTQKLGDAVLAQQSDVMDAVQALRARAEDQKQLQTNKQQKVTVRTEQNRRVIAIEPAEPELVYVPYYEPTVYGAWPYAEYPAYWWPNLYGWPYGLAGAAIGWGIGWGIWNNWGGGVNWGNNNINIDRNNNRWNHVEHHRRGVRYNNADVARRFDKNGDKRLANSDRIKDFRGNRPDSGRDAVRDNSRVDNRRDGNRADNRRADNKGNKANKAGSSQRRDAKGNAGRNQAAARGNAGQRQAGNTARSRQSGNTARSRQSGNAFANMQHGNRAQNFSHRGRQSMAFGGGGGGFRGGGGGGFRGGGGGGFRGGGGGRRSDIALKHDISLLGQLGNGVGLYRFSYYGSDRAYVGVMAQEVQAVMPNAVTRGTDGYLRVYYGKLGFKFQTYENWIASGSRLPRAFHISH